MRSPFEAKYNGVCAACSERWFADELIQYFEDDLMHAECAEEMEQMKQFTDKLEEPTA